MSDSEQIIEAKEAHRDSRQVINIINKVPKNERGCTSRGCLIAFIALLIFILLSSVIGKFGVSGNQNEYMLEVDSLNKNFISGNVDSKNQILRIKVNGVIAFNDSSSSFFSDSIASAEAICMQLEAAAQDNEIKGVILQINSPGGEVVAADTIYNAIVNYKKSGKSIVAQMESLAASGGYYVAAPTDRIIANSLTTTGSIGVIIQSFKYYELLNKIGLQSESYTSGDKKDILSPTRPTTQEEQRILQQHIDKVFDRFVEIVAESRPGLSVESIKNSSIGSGQIFLGTEAKELKLVDQLGYFDDAVKAICELSSIPEKEFVIVDYSLNPPFLRQLQSLLVSGEKAEFKLSLPGASNSSATRNGLFYYMLQGVESF